jgi:hypothetical protein
MLKELIITFSEESFGPSPLTVICSAVLCCRIVLGACKQRALLHCSACNELGKTHETATGCTTKLATEGAARPTMHSLSRIVASVSPAESNTQKKK